MPLLHRNDSSLLSEQPLPLPLLHRPIAIVLAFPLSSIRRVEQIVHIARHTAPASRRRSIDSLEGESRARQLPTRVVAVRI